MEEINNTAAIRNLLREALILANEDENHACCRTGAFKGIREALEMVSPGDVAAWAETGEWLA